MCSSDLCGAAARSGRLRDAGSGGLRRCSGRVPYRLDSHSPPARGDPHQWGCLQDEQTRKGEVSAWLPRQRTWPPSTIPRGPSLLATAVQAALSSSSRMAGTVVLHRLRCEGGKRGGGATQEHLHRPAREATWPTSRSRRRLRLATAAGATPRQAPRTAPSFTAASVEKGLASARAHKRPASVPEYKWEGCRQPPPAPHAAAQP